MEYGWRPGHGRHERLLHEETCDQQDGASGGDFKIVGMDQQHLFQRGLALALLGIGNLLDALVHK